METPKSTMVLGRTLRIYFGVVLVIFAVLFLRLTWLQLIQTSFYQLKAVSNTMRWIPEKASRGEIVDRNGEVLVTNRPVFNISLNYLGLKDQDIDEVITKLVQIINDPEISYDSVKTLLKGKNRLYEPIVIKRDVSMELVTAIEERRREMPGVSVDVQPQRTYIYGSLAGHLLGYVHSIKEELDTPGFEDYSINDLVGKTGVEKYYETYLRGQKGFRQVEVTSHNQPVQEVRAISSVPGDKLVLTIDLKLQQAMENSFDEVLAKVQKTYPKAKAGGAVLLDVKTGKTLAMVSRPGLNPEDFNGKSLSQEQADYYFSNEPPALRNRAIQGNYVPGSTFKPVTGMAVLEAAQATPLDTVVCTGKYWFSPYIKCWTVHGRVNYYSAMARSCNVYFQEMGRRAGIAQIGKVGLEVGLGDRTGIDLPFESKGILPDLEWQKNEFGLRREKINQEINRNLEQLEKEYGPKIKAAADQQEKKRLENELKSKKRVWEQRRRERLELYTKWHDWDTFNTSIGQGFNQYTVIQLANYTATIASGGKRYKPSVVERIIDNVGIVVEEFDAEPILISTIDPTTFAETKKAMTAVTAPGGTAYSLFRNFPVNIKVAAKTGTAQPGRAGYIKNKDFDGVFIAFAPVDDPQIAFAGVIEHGYSGGGSIGLVAKAVFEEYFGINKQKQVKTRSTSSVSDGQSAPENPDTETSTETPVQTEDVSEETSPETPVEIPAEIPETIIPEQIPE